MQLALDNLLAAIVGFTVAVILLSVQTDINDHSIERMRYYAARRSQAVFLQTLERDLHNVVSLNSVAMGPTDSTFSFTAQLDSTNTQTGTVAYRYKRVGTVSGTPIFRVIRSVTRGGVTTVEGGSLNAITGWTIQARSDDNVAVAAPSGARQIYVWFSGVSPLLSGAGSQRLQTSVGTVNWEARYRPPALRPSTDV